MDGRSVLAWSDPVGTCRQAVSGWPLAASAATLPAGEPRPELRSCSCGRLPLSSWGFFLLPLPFSFFLSLFLLLSLSSSLFLFHFIFSFSVSSPPFFLFLFLSFCFFLSLSVSLFCFLSSPSFLSVFLFLSFFCFCRILETALISHLAGRWAPRSWNAHDLLWDS